MASIYASIYLDRIMPAPPRDLAPYPIAHMLRDPEWDELQARLWESCVRALDTVDALELARDGTSGDVYATLTELVDLAHNEWRLIEGYARRFITPRAWGRRGAQ